MSLPRTTFGLLLLVALCVGLPLTGQGQLAPATGGGDGGVVILPSAFTLTSGVVDIGLPEAPASDPVHEDESDESENPESRGTQDPHVEGSEDTGDKRFRVSVSIVDNDVIRLVIPDEMHSAYAVMIVEGSAIRVPVQVISGQIALSSQLLADLGHHVQTLQILVVSSNGLALNLTIRINGDEISVTVT